MGQSQWGQGAQKTAPRGGRGLQRGAAGVAGAGQCLEGLGAGYRQRPLLPRPAAVAGARGLAAPVSSSLAAFVLETHVCLGAQSGWKGHRHFIAHGCQRVPQPRQAGTRAQLR